MKSACVALRALLLAAALAVSASAGPLKTGVQPLPGPLPALGEADSAIALDFDLSREMYFLAVPRGYSPYQPYGLLVFVSPVDECLAVPPGWDGVLQQKKLIFVAPQNADNPQPVSRRVGLALVAAARLPQMATIDTNRVFVAGFSGGARVACHAAFLRPNLVSGVLAICGADFCRKVERVKATRTDDYGWFPVDDARAAAAKARVRFALVTGPGDFRYGNILDIYSGGFQKDVYSVKLLDVPGMGHEVCSAKALGEGLAFLDGRKPASAVRK